MNRLMNQVRSILIGCSACLCAYGCADQADFGGNSGTDKAAAQEPEAPAAPAPKTCDISGDFVDLSFPANIQACIDAGNLYNFDSGACSDIPKASTFDCDFDSLTEATEAINISVPAFADAKAKGAKLIGCGERRGGKTVVAQWVKSQINEETCEFKDGMTVVTGCFQQDTGDGQTVEGTPEEIVAACLSGG